MSFYITSPIYYVNDKPHIGHAYTGLACDVVARYHRLCGEAVYFLTGTDEHGQKVENSAAAQGQSPQAFTDKLSREFRKLAETMNFSHDDFIRTTEPRHKKGAQALWQRLSDKGEIYLGNYEGWYVVRDEAFYAESELQKTEDGKLTTPAGAVAEWLSEPSYFFRLSKWQEPLLQFYRENPSFIAPESRRNEVISFVKGGLKDLSVSRSGFSWGVEVPNDKDHVMYVWLDALANYMTALGYGGDETSLYEKFWPADLHIVGKDIVRFHAVYWPAFLMAAELPLPKRVFAHGWWTNEGQKISKSLGNVIDPYALIDTYGLDQVRYFLLREIPFGNDGDFNHTAMVRRINADLANDLGNLCQRILSFTYRYCAAAIPSCGELQNEDNAFLQTALQLPETLAKTMQEQNLAESLQAIWEIIAAANIYVNHSAPWALRKTDEARMQTVLYVALSGIYYIALALQAFMPHTAEKILGQLGFAEEMIDFATGFVEKPLTESKPIPEPSALLPRITEENTQS